MTLSIIASLSSQAKQALTLPSAGQVSCGFPSPATDYATAELSLDELVGLSPTSSLFLMRAWGDSMRDDGIFDGDVLVVDKAREAKVGNIVVAVVNAELVAKKLGYTEAGEPALIASNSQYLPLLINAEEGIEIWGVCMWNLHKLVS